MKMFFLKNSPQSAFDTIHYSRCKQNKLTTFTTSVPSKALCRKNGSALWKIGSTDFLKMCKIVAFSYETSLFSVKTTTFGSKTLLTFCQIGPSWKPLEGTLFTTNSFQYFCTKCCFKVFDLGPILQNFTKLEEFLCQNDILKLKSRKSASLTRKSIFFTHC